MNFKWELIVLLIITGSFSCSKDVPVINIDNLSAGTVLVLGHGGMGNKSLLPMDSQPSLDKCLQSNADGSEMDVRMSADGVLYLFHDQELKHATGSTGWFKQKTSEELDQLSYKWLKGEKHLLKLEDLLTKQQADNSRHYTFDCKLEHLDDTAYVYEFARKLAWLIEKFNLKNRCYLESFNSDFILWMNQAHPDYKMYLYCNKLVRAIELKSQLKVYGLVMDHQYLSAVQRDSIRSIGWRLTLFNVASTDEHRKALALQPDCIQTDDIDKTLTMLGRY